MNKKLGGRITQARKRAGLTQEKLAKMLDIAYPTLNKYEKGHRIPDAELLSRMAKLLHCNPGWLLTGEGPAERDGVDMKPSSIYNVKENDSDLAEILQMLQEHPEDKKLVLKLLKGKKDIQEALEGFGIKNLLREEG